MWQTGEKILSKRKGEDCNKHIPPVVRKLFPINLNKLPFIHNLEPCRESRSDPWSSLDILRHLCRKSRHDLILFPK